jgi:predicted MFS family arabinose efflux permease
MRTPPATASPVPNVAAVCVSEVFGLAGYAIVPALLPQFFQAWSLTGAQGGWLAGIMFAGYMAAVLPMVSLTDRVPPRTVYLASSALGALANFGIAVSQDFGGALAFRALAGIALAGMYMPGLRALTDRLEGPRRARVAAYYTSSFTIGASLSFLLGRVGLLWGWQSAFIAAGVLGVLGTLIAWASLPRPTPAPPAQPPRLPFRLKALVTNRNVLALIIAYAAVIWGSTGLRQWIVLFLNFCADNSGSMVEEQWQVLATAAAIGFLGVPAGLLGNELAIRFGLRTTGTVLFLVAALANGLFALSATGPFAAAILLSLVAGFVVQGNFSNLTSGVLAAADPRYTGATIALYSCIGFGGGFIGTVIFGVTLDGFGGSADLAAWVLRFGTCALASLAGAAATAVLSSKLR